MGTDALISPAKGNLHAQEAERIVCESSYWWFFTRAWEILEPETPFIRNWHIRYLCDILQTEIERIAKREPKTFDLLINEPPRSAKSLVVTICLAPWAWTKYPHLRFINVSYAENLATEHCMLSRRLVESDWYQRHWGGRFKITTDQNQKSYFENNMRGYRRSCPSRSLTGAGADLIIWDDPQNPEMAESEIERESVKRIYGQTGYSRLNDQKVGLRVVIQQRLHEDDISGHLLTNAADKYLHICLPAELTDDVSPKEVRQYYVDGLLFPHRFSWDVLASAKLPTALGAYGYASQMLQRPSPPEGGTFKRWWWRFWVPKGTTLPPPAFKDVDGKLCSSQVVELPEQFDRVINSWDTAVEGGAGHDYWAGGVWAAVGAAKFLLDQKREQWDYPQGKRAVKALYNSTANVSALLIEKSSNGPAIKADLARELPGIITIPTGKLSKEDRVRFSDTVPYAAQVEAGNIYLPHPSLPGCEWVNGFIDEHAKFPKSRNDDQVDQSAQGVNYLTNVRHVWPYYHPFDINHHRAFQIRWINYLHYGALVLGKDMGISLLSAVWDMEYRKLYIYGAIVAQEWSARSLANRMVEGMHLTTRKCVGIYGNSLMFREQTKTTARLMTQEIARAFLARGHQRGVPVIEPYQYDRPGAISLANLMFHRDDIIVHTAAVEASRQFSAWYIDKTEPAEGFGLCEALTIIVSELDRTARIREKSKPPVDGYRPVKMPETLRQRTVSQNSWQAT